MSRRRRESFRRVRVVTPRSEEWHRQQAKLNRERAQIMNDLMTDWWKSLKPGDPIMTFDGKGEFVKVVEGLAQFDLENGEIQLPPQIRYVVNNSKAVKQCAAGYCKPI